MKNKLTYTFLIVLSYFMVSCSTDDVDGETAIINPDPVEIPDKAFGEYMLFREVSGVFSETENGEEKYYLRPTEVLTVSELSLSKTGSNTDALINAGLATAETKITDVTGIAFFTGLQRLILTSNNVEQIDVSSLEALEALEINFNLVGGLNVSQNTQLNRLRYRGSAQASDNQKLSEIDVSNNVNLRHLFLPNHNIVSIDLSNNTQLDELLDLSGNPGPDGNPDTPDIVIPAEIYNQLGEGNRLGVISDADTGPIDDPDPVLIPDKAFGEYMLFREITGVFEEVVDGEVNYFLNPNEVQFVTQLLLSKTGSNTQSLIDAGLATAEDKITDLTGIEYFTGLQRLVLTSNDVEDIDLTNLVALEELEMNFNLIGSLDLSTNTALTRLRYRGSAQANSDQKLNAIDLSNNINLRHLFLTNHNLVTIDLSNNTQLDDLLDLRGNPGPNNDPDNPGFVIPAAIYNQLGAGNRFGVVPD